MRSWIMSSLGRSVGRLSRPERVAVEAIARRFGKDWEESGQARVAHIIGDGTRTAVDLVALNRKITDSRLRLLHDKVVVWLTQRLQAALAEIVPDGVTVVLTVTAPIRQAAKTAAALEEDARACLERESSSRSRRTIHGNRTQVLLLQHETQKFPKTLVFVYNPDSDPGTLVNSTHDLIELRRARTGADKRDKHRWLALISSVKISYLEPYRYICAQLGLADNFEKILLVLENGKVESLAE